MVNEGKKILVVEDDNTLRSILVDRLALSHYKVAQAADGLEAQEQIEALRPHLILLDLMLPKVDGYEVLEGLRKHSDPDVSKTAVIIFSNLWSDKDILRAKALKVDEYYVKANTDLEDVFARVKQLLEA